MVVETYGGVFVKPYMIEVKLRIAGVTKDGNKTVLHLTDKDELDKAIKIAREKILAAMLLNGANWH